MAWDFSTDPEWAEQLGWVDEFVRSECEPIDLIVKESHDLNDPVRQALIPPLQKIVKERGLWATHLGPHLGGPGYGQVKLALLNEILGRSECAPIVFGSQAPDSGNSEILAALRHSRAEEALPGAASRQPHRVVLLDDRTAGRRRSEGVHDDRGGRRRSLDHQRREVVLVVRVDGVVHHRDGDDRSGCAALRTVFDVRRAGGDAGYQRAARRRPRAPAAGRRGREGYVRYENVRVPADHMLGPRGGAFVVAQTRLGGGRIHHAMRTVGLVRRIYDMLCERAVSRYTQGGMLSDKQMVQEMVADSWMEIEAFRLLTLQTAWKIDQHNDYKAVRADISAVKAMMQKVLHDVSARALQLHGSLGTTHEMPFVSYLVESFVLGLADGPTEVHKVTLARLLLKDQKPAPDMFPSEHLLRLREAAEAKFADKLAGIPRT